MGPMGTALTLMDNKAEREISTIPYLTHDSQARLGKGLKKSTYLLE